MTYTEYLKNNFLGNSKVMHISASHSSIVHGHFVMGTGNKAVFVPC